MFFGIPWKLASAYARYAQAQLKPLSYRQAIANFLNQVRPVGTDTPLIRIGGDGDGGYLVPDDLEGIAACFSPGVGAVSTFEADMARRGIRTFLADYSVDGPAEHHPLFKFEKKYLGIVNDATHMTLDSWVENEGPFHGDLVLQMDIEGGEYDVLVDASNSVLARFRMMVIEFHRLDVQVADPASLAWLRRVFLKLSKHFEVVHIHPNNVVPPVMMRGLAIPPYVEFTFLRRDRVRNKVPAASYPHPLDRPNVPERPDVALPECWYLPRQT